MNVFVAVLLSLYAGGAEAEVLYCGSDMDKALSVGQNHMGNFSELMVEEWEDGEVVRQWRNGVEEK